MYVMTGFTGGCRRGISEDDDTKTTSGTIRTFR